MVSSYKEFCEPTYEYYFDNLLNLAVLNFLKNISFILAKCHKYLTIEATRVDEEEITHATNKLKDN